jgi:IS30 family transposase
MAPSSQELEPPQNPGRFSKSMKCCPEFTCDTSVKVYCCNPHSLWQRCSGKITNRLLRQYPLKGTDLSARIQADLDAIAGSQNNRPRGTHAFHSPVEVFAAMLKAAHQPSTSIH